MVRDMAPAMKAAYPDGKALAALRDYHKVLDIVGRNKGVSYSGNSTSIEKLFGDAPIESFGGKLWKNLSDTLVGHVLAGGAIGSAVGGPVGGAVGVGAGVLSKTASEHYRKVAASLMQDAITNPETADMLMKIARGAKIPAAAIDSRLMSLGIVGSSNIGSSTPDESASMTDGGTAPTEYTYENGELVPR